MTTNTAALASLRNSPTPAPPTCCSNATNRTGAKSLLHVAERTLTGMAQGGVYDQIAGGFHRYSVDERWCVPHFEKMTYDNSELLKNYLHGYQVAGNPLFRETAEGIITWVNEVLSDQARGGFYGSQDADQTLDDDGDYFTWTLAEVRAVLTPEESRVAELYYDVNARGEMHHNSAKNVLWVTAGPETIAAELKIGEDSCALAAGQRQKKTACRAAPAHPGSGDRHHRLRRLECHVRLRLPGSRPVLGRDDCRAFALKTLDRILAEAWEESKGFLHRVGGPRLDGSLDDQISWSSRSSMPMKRPSTAAISKSPSAPCASP